MPPCGSNKVNGCFKDHHVYDVAIQSRGHSVLSESRSFCSSNLLRRGITQRSVVQINLRKLSGARQFPWKLQAPEKIKKRKSWFAKNRCRSEAPDVAPYTPLPATVVAQRQVGYVGAYRAGGRAQGLRAVRGSAWPWVSAVYRVRGDRSMSRCWAEVQKPLP
jgi:hypothetical protein